MVQVVRGQGLGQNVTHRTPCREGDSDPAFGVVFRDLSPGAEMTLRATASGYVAQEKTVIPSLGPQKVVLIWLSRPQDVGLEGRISANHGHTAVVSTGQIRTLAAVRLDIRGSADHSHTLDLDRDDLVYLLAGAGLTKTSSWNAGHDHVVTFPGSWDY
jgi:hypothetical protein